MQRELPPRRSKNQALLKISAIHSWETCNEQSAMFRAAAEVLDRELMSENLSIFEREQLEPDVLPPAQATALDTVNEAEDCPDGWPDDWPDDEIKDDEDDEDDDGDDGDGSDNSWIDHDSVDSEDAEWLPMKRQRSLLPAGNALTGATACASVPRDDAADIPSSDSSQGSSSSENEDSDNETPANANDLDHCSVASSDSEVYCLSDTSDGTTNHLLDSNSGQASSGPSE